MFRVLFSKLYKSKAYQGGLFANKKYKNYGRDGDYEIYFICQSEGYKKRKNFYIANLLLKVSFITIIKNKGKLLEFNILRMCSYANILKIF